MALTIRTIYIAPEGESSTNAMDAIKFIVEGTGTDIYGGMTLFTSQFTEVRKKLGVFYDDTLMRIVETKEEGEDLINRLNKACSLLEDLPVNETASIIKLFHQTDYQGKIVKGGQFFNESEAIILDI